MTIEKVYMGLKNDPMNSTGTEVETAINALIDQKANPSGRPAARALFHQGFNSTSPFSPTPSGDASFNDVTSGAATGNTLTTSVDVTGTVGTAAQAGVLRYGDSYKFATVVSVSATTITLEGNLNEIFEDLPTGPLAITYYLRHSGVNANHLSDAGSRAYAEALYSTDATELVRDSALVYLKYGEEYERSPWTKLSPAIWQPYGGLPSNMLSYQNTLNISTPTNEYVASSDTQSLQAISDALGEGVEYVYDNAGAAVTVQFTTGIHSDDQRLGLATVLLDGREIYSKQFRNTLALHTVPVAGGSQVTIRVVQNDSDTTATKYRVGELLFLSASPPYSKAVQDNSSVLMLGDSWFDEQGLTPIARPGFAEHTRLLSGATVNTDYAKGGMTSTWGLAWVEEALNVVKPDTVLIHFYLNDHTSMGGSVLGDDVDPEGDALDINVDDLAHYIANMSGIISACLNRGVTPVVLLASPTGSLSLNQSLITDGLTRALGNPVLLKEHILEATDDELNNIASRVNVVGKAPGRSIRNVENATVYYATGSSAGDAWEPMNTAGTAITPM